MDRKHLLIVITAYLFHFFVIFILPLLTVLQDEWIGSYDWKDYGIFMTYIVKPFLTDPRTIYGEFFNWFPVYVYVYLPFYYMNVDSFVIVQALVFFPCVYYCGELLSRKNLDIKVFTIFMFLFVGMWVYTYNYRAANDKLFVLCFLVMALWGIEKKKHPLIPLIGLTMVVSRILYFAPMLLYYIVEDFNWKKTLMAIGVFLGLNSLFVLYPQLIWSFANNALSLSTEESFLAGESGGYVNASFGLFMYLRVIFPQYIDVSFIIGAGILFCSYIWLWWKKYPLIDYCLYLPILTTMFFPVIEFQHVAFLIPPLMLFYFRNWPLTFKGQKLISIPMLRQWLPFICLIGMAFPIPVGLIDFLPIYLQPFRVLIFSISFFVLTLKKGLLWPFYEGKIPNLKLKE